MKRTISFLLVLAMVFTLCACGGGKVEAPVSEPVPTSEQKQEPTEEPETQASIDEDAPLAVEDFEITNVGENGSFSFRVKIRNISDKDLNTIPLFNYQVLDKNGDIILNEICAATSTIAAGQAIWAGPYRITDTAHQDEFATICFVSSPDLGNGGTKLREKAEYGLENYLMNNEITVENTAEPDTAKPDELVEDPIEIEETIIHKSTSGYKICMKVRNTSDEAKELIELNLQILDSNGDILDTADICAYNLESGQAGKTDYDSFECDLDEIASVKVAGYRYGTGTELIKKFNSRNRYKLKESIIIPIDDILIE